MLIIQNTTGMPHLKTKLYNGFSRNMTRTLCYCRPPQRHISSFPTDESKKKADIRTCEAT